MVGISSSSLAVSGTWSVSSGNFSNMGRFISAARSATNEPSGANNRKGTPVIWTSTRREASVLVIISVFENPAAVMNASMLDTKISRLPYGAKWATEPPFIIEPFLCYLIQRCSLLDECKLTVLGLIDWTWVSSMNTRRKLKGSARVPSRATVIPFSGAGSNTPATGMTELSFKKPTRSSLRELTYKSIVSCGTFAIDTVG